MKVDLLVKNVKVFNSYLKKFKDGNVAILNNKFLYIDNNKNIEFEASSTIDGKNQYMIPGFIDIPYAYRKFYDDTCTFLPSSF